MPPSPKRQATYARGRHAELQAAAHLQAQGYEVLKERYKTPYGEIDLIVGRDTLLVFVEVKARVDEVRALESLQPRQIKRIIAAAEHFLIDISHINPDIRFDVITISAAGLTHLEHAFEKEWE